MSTKNNPSKLHPEILKIYNSPNYRKKVKRMVERIKMNYFAQTGKVMGKLPNRLKLAKKAPSDAELAAFRKANEFRMDKQVVHYFAQTIEMGMDRRAISGGRDEAAE